MHLLRKAIRKLILEGPAKDEFDEIWFNTDIDRSRWDDTSDVVGTNHRDMIRSRKDWSISEEDIDALFRQKRDLKRLWNDMVEKHGSRSFWQGPKMTYFHSLSYYVQSDSLFGDSDMKQRALEDGQIKNLSIKKFFDEYKMSGNKDEMSTWGIYKGAPVSNMFDQFDLGVILRGRVTLASKGDAWVESRSKATAKDIETHRSSGMPKRLMPTGYNVVNLLFDESDMHPPIRVKPYPPGECVLDNWSIVGIVFNPHKYSAEEGKALQAFADSKGIPLRKAQEFL
jgi:hypothetical protein